MRLFCQLATSDGAGRCPAQVRAGRQLSRETAQEPGGDQGVEPYTRSPSAASSRSLDAPRRRHHRALVPVEAHRRSASPGSWHRARDPRGDRQAHPRGGASELFTSHVIGDDELPSGFYDRLGFIPTGELDPNGERILRLDLERFGLTTDGRELPGDGFVWCAGRPDRGTTMAGSGAACEGVGEAGASPTHLGHSPDAGWKSPNVASSGSRRTATRPVPGMSSGPRSTSPPSSRARTAAASTSSVAR